MIHPQPYMEPKHLYDGFISYSQHQDKQLADALQKGLRGLGAKRYLLQFRALEIFRDETDSSGNDGLKEKIDRGIDTSEYLILLACPAVAWSSSEENRNWVEEEIRQWLAKQQQLAVEDLKIIICITAGEIRWDYESEDFDWQATDCLPTLLKRKFSNQPLWVDLREVKGKEKETVDSYSLEYPAFKQKVAEISAKIQGKSVDDILSDDKNRKALWAILLGVAAILLLLLTSLSIYFSINATRSKEEAINNLKQYEYKKLQELLSNAQIYDKAGGSIGRDKRNKSLDTAMQLIGKYPGDSLFIEELAKINMFVK